jgi:putrescine---pyruvate transaminase
VMAAVQLDPDLVAADATLPERVAFAARDEGVLTRTLVGGGLQISPAFVITPEELEELATGIGAALDTVAAQVPATATS